MVVNIKTFLIPLMLFSITQIYSMQSEMLKRHHFFDNGINVVGVFNPATKKTSNVCCAPEKTNVEYCGEIYNATIDYYTNKSGKILYRIKFKTNIDAPEMQILVPLSDRQKDFFNKMAKEEKRKVYLQLNEFYPVTHGYEPNLQQILKSDTPMSDKVYHIALEKEGLMSCMGSVNATQMSNFDLASIPEFIFPHQKIFDFNSKSTQETKYKDDKAKLVQDYYPTLKAEEQVSFLQRGHSLQKKANEIAEKEEKERQINNIRKKLVNNNEQKTPADQRNENQKREIASQEEIVMQAVTLFIEEQDYKKILPYPNLPKDIFTQQTFNEFPLSEQNALLLAAYNACEEENLNAKKQYFQEINKGFTALLKTIDFDNTSEKEVQKKNQLLCQTLSLYSLFTKNPNLNITTIDQFKNKLCTDVRKIEKVDGDGGGKKQNKGILTQKFDTLFQLIDLELQEINKDTEYQEEKLKALKKRDRHIVILGPTYQVGQSLAMVQLGTFMGNSLFSLIPNPEIEKEIKDLEEKTSEKEHAKYLRKKERALEVNKIILGEKKKLTVKKLLKQCKDLKNEQN